MLQHNDKKRRAEITPSATIYNPDTQQNAVSAYVQLLPMDTRRDPKDPMWGQEIRSRPNYEPSTATRPQMGDAVLTSDQPRYVQRARLLGQPTCALSVPGFVSTVGVDPTIPLRFAGFLGNPGADLAGTNQKDNLGVMYVFGTYTTINTGDDTIYPGDTVVLDPEPIEGRGTRVGYPGYKHVPATRPLRAQAIADALAHIRGAVRDFWTAPHAPVNTYNDLFAACFTGKVASLDLRTDAQRNNEPDLKHPQTAYAMLAAVQAIPNPGQRDPLLSALVPVLLRNRQARYATVVPPSRAIGVPNVLPPTDPLQVVELLSNYVVDAQQEKYRLVCGIARYASVPGAQLDLFITM